MAVDPAWPDLDLHIAERARLVELMQYCKRVTPQSTVFKRHFQRRRRRVIDGQTVGDSGNTASENMRRLRATQRRHLVAHMRDFHFTLQIFIFSFFHSNSVCVQCEFIVGVFIDFLLFVILSQWTQYTSIFFSFQYRSNVRNKSVKCEPWMAPPGGGRHARPSPAMTERRQRHLPMTSRSPRPLVSTTMGNCESDAVTTLHHAPIRTLESRSNENQSVPPLHHRHHTPAPYTNENCWK